MEPQFSELQALVDMGLTLLEAKVYLALVESGPSKTSAISKVSKVAQPDVYKTLIKLQELGLVEKIIKTPHEYRAIPITEAVSFLLETKRQQYNKVRAEARMLLNEAKMKKPTKIKQVEKPQFIFVPEGRAVIEKINEAIEKVQLSIDLVISWKRFSRGIASTFAETIEKAWKKGVKIRFIIEKPVNSKTSKELTQFCREKPNCQVKFIRKQPEIVFGIYDRKEIFIILFSKTDLPGSPALWSNSDALITLASDRFETLWRKARQRLD